MVIRITAGILILLVAVVGGLATYLHLTAIKPTRLVGFQEVRAIDAGRPSFPFAIWYPTTGKPRIVLRGSRAMRVVPDGPVEGTHVPLIVFSHGTGGSAFDHSDTAIALAEQGFIVAAPTHPGDNSQDASEVGQPRWLMNRSRDVSGTIDAVLHTWAGRRHVDSVRVGVFGFSAGGTTALISIGGKPNLRVMRTHCAKQPEFACRLVSPSIDEQLVSDGSMADGRISAAVVAAPAFVFTFQPGGLSDVRTPVQLWVGAADQTVPYATNAAIVLRLLPRRPEVHIVPRAPHVSFVMPCGFVGWPQSCPTDSRFNRTNFHKAFNANVARFFRKHFHMDPKQAS